jgi:hypothetical protein
VVKRKEWNGIGKENAKQYPVEFKRFLFPVVFKYVNGARSRVAKEVTAFRKIRRERINRMTDEK